MAQCSKWEETNSSDLSDDDIMHINVCGMMYVTLKSTLERFPSTLLGNNRLRAKYYFASKKSYFFDRHRQSFEAILYYYQSNGVLIRPPAVPLPVFEKEIVFFRLGKPALETLLKNEGYFIPDERKEPIQGWQRKLWEMFERPDSSFTAKLLSCWSMSIITISIIVFCLETMPEFRTRTKTLNSVDSASQPRNRLWVSLELGCIIWFTIEYILRFISSPNKCVFFKSFQTIIDLLVILPYFIAKILLSGHIVPLSVLKIIELVRIFRVLKFSRHSYRLQVLGLTLKASVRELCMLVFFLFLGVISFSTAMYFAENNHSERFLSIPDAFWYCLVTMTTVGYGDKVPATDAGKFIGSLCAITGVLTLALPVPVIVSNFDYFYRRDRNVYEYNDDFVDEEVSDNVYNDDNE